MPLNIDHLSRSLERNSSDFLRNHICKGAIQMCKAAIQQPPLVQVEVGESRLKSGVAGRGATLKTAPTLTCLITPQRQSLRVPIEEQLRTSAIASVAPLPPRSFGSLRPLLGQVEVNKAAIQQPPLVQGEVGESRLKSGVAGRGATSKTAPTLTCLITPQRQSLRVPTAAQRRISAIASVAPLPPRSFGSLRPLLGQGEVNKAAIQQPPLVRGEVGESRLKSGVAGRGATSKTAPTLTCLITPQRQSLRVPTAAQRRTSAIASVAPLPQRPFGALRPLLGQGKVNVVLTACI